LSQGKKDACIVGDGWTSTPGAHDDFMEGDGGMAEEDVGEMVPEEEGEVRWDDSHEPGEIIEGYNGMEPGHNAGTMDVPNRPLPPLLHSAQCAINHPTPLPSLNTSDGAISEPQSISLNSPKRSVSALPLSFGPSPGPTSHFPAPSHQSNQGPMSSSPVSHTHSPTASSPSFQASNLFGDTGTENMETSPMMSTFSTHAQKAVGGASLGKGKQPMSLKGPCSHNSSSPTTSQASSLSRKRSHDVSSEISNKIADASDLLIRHIQDSLEARVETKRLKYEAVHQYRELRAREQHGEHEHQLQLMMEKNQHLLSLVNSENKKLKLELELEKLRIHCMELELMQGSSSGSGATGSPLGTDHTD